MVKSAARAVGSQLGRSLIRGVAGVGCSADAVMNLVGACYSFTEAGCCNS